MAYTSTSQLIIPVPNTGSITNAYALYVDSGGVVEGDVIIRHAESPGSLAGAALGVVGALCLSKRKISRRALLGLGGKR